MGTQDVASWEEDSRGPPCSSPLTQGHRPRLAPRGHKAAARTWSSFFENVLQIVTEGTVTQEQARIKLTETFTKAVRFTVGKRGAHGGSKPWTRPAALHASGSSAPNAPQAGAGQGGGGRRPVRTVSFNATVPRARAAPALAGRPSSCCETAAWTMGALGPAPAAPVPAAPAPGMPSGLEPPGGHRPLRPPPGLAPRRAEAAPRASPSPPSA